MQVLLTNSLFFHQKYGGVSRYASALIKSLIDEKVDLKIISPLFKNNYLQKIKEVKKYGIYIPRYPKSIILRHINNFFNNYLKKNLNSNLIHNLYYPETENFLQKKTILTIHDTIHEKYSHMYNFDYFNFRKKIIQNTDLLICVSEKTKNDVIELYQVPENKIFVTPHGFDHLSYIEIEDLKKDKIFEKPFILYVGGRYKYKNFSLLSKAFSKSQKIKDNFNIICFGGEKISDSEKKNFKNLGIENKIIELRGDDKLLKSLYLKTNLLVSTSEYEGFGINVLEALSLDCPILANKIEVFQDIFKDSILYYEHNNEDSLIFNLENNIYNS